MRIALVMSLKAEEGDTEMICKTNKKNKRMKTFKLKHVFQNKIFFFEIFKHNSSFFGKTSDYHNYFFTFSIQIKFRDKYSMKA